MINETATATGLGPWGSGATPTSAAVCLCATASTCSASSFNVQGGEESEGLLSKFLDPYGAVSGIGEGLEYVCNFAQICRVSAPPQQTICSTSAVLGGWFMEMEQQQHPPS
ncbi:hypothetical protein Dimus_006590 [Dionaea muscipula]